MRYRYRPRPTTRTPRGRAQAIASKIPPVDYAWLKALETDGFKISYPDYD